MKVSPHGSDQSSESQPEAVKDNPPAAPQAQRPDQPATEKQRQLAHTRRHDHQAASAQRPPSVSSVAAAIVARPPAPRAKAPVAHTTVTAVSHPSVSRARARRARVRTTEFGFEHAAPASPA